jgi:hypothetical protein
MATREQIYTAIRNADAAGDVESVQKLGAYLRTLPSESADSAPTGPAKPASERNAVVDAGNALGTGYFRGLTRLAGLPVDTVANVVDLGKAAIGSGYQAVTGKPAPEALQLTPRKDVVGSGDWMLDKLSQTRGGNLLVNPANPEYEGGYTQALGGGLTAVMNPSSAGQAVNQAVLGATSAAAGKGAYDATGNTALAVTASMLPGAAQAAASEGTRRLIRGGEEGRRRMEQRVQDLKEAGIDEPTLGLASGNKLIEGAENLLQNTPGAIGRMQTARERTIAALRDKSEGAASRASTNRGALESGTAIQGGIRDFKDRFKDRQEVLYDRLGDVMGDQHPTQVAGTKQQLAELNADIKGAPNLSKFFKNKTIQQLEEAMQADTAGAPETVMVVPRPPRGSGDLMNTPIPQEPLLVKIPEAPNTNTLPFEAVRKTRTLVGGKVTDASLLDDVPRSKWKQLYGALSEDIGTTAHQAGPEAERAFNRANQYTRSGINRLERVEPFERKTAPEQAFTALVNATRENTSTLQAVKKTLPPDARGTIAGTVIERLGKARNSLQNDTGTGWSHETFLTNWNKMTPKAREELFSGFPNAPEVKANVESVAQAASMMRDGSRMWNNPSGTGANLAARATLGGLGVGGAGAALGMLNPWVPLAIAGGMGGANAAARAVTGPRLRQFALKPGYMDPALLDAQARALLTAQVLREGQ